jgi:hypothetical protein
MYVLHHQLNLETFNCRTSYINAFQYSQQISLFVRFIIKRTHQKSSLVNFQNWKAHWASILIYIILINHLTPTYLHTQNTKAKRAQKGYLPSPFKSTSPITIKTGCTFKRGTKTTLSPPVIHTQRRKNRARVLRVQYQRFWSFSKWKLERVGILTLKMRSLLSETRANPPL